MLKMEAVTEAEEGGGGPQTESPFANVATTVGRTIASY